MRGRRGKRTLLSTLRAGRTVHVGWKKVEDTGTVASRSNQRDRRKMKG